MHKKVFKFSRDEAFGQVDKFVKNRDKKCGLDIMRYCGCHFILNFHTYGTNGMLAYMTTLKKFLLDVNRG